MKEIRVDDYWERVIDYYCNSEEKAFMDELDEDCFEKLATEYEEVIVQLKKFLEDRVNK